MGVRSAGLKPVPTSAEYQRVYSGAAVSLKSEPKGRRQQDRRGGLFARCRFTTELPMEHAVALNHFVKMEREGGRPDCTTGKP